MYFNIWCFRRLAKRWGDCPGINDGLITRWFWTHDPQYVKELVERSQRWDIVGETCRWMLASVRERHPLLDVALYDLGFHE